MNSQIFSFSLGSESSFGCIDNGILYDIGAHISCPDLGLALTKHSVSELLDMAERAPQRSPEKVKYLPLIPHSEKLLCVGINYRTHGSEVKREEPKHPSFFVRFSNSIVGHRQSIVKPLESDQFDYEGELAVIISRRGRRIPASRAEDFIAGYSCFLDNAVRDWQMHTTQATAGKNFVSSGAFGPSLVSVNQVRNVEDQTLVTRLNNEVVQQASLGDMIFSIPELIEYASTFTELAPGDVISTGTPAGVGLAHTPPIWLKAGDALEVEISGVGRLQTQVVDETSGNPRVEE